MFKRNSTIAIKEKICISCGKSCVWFSKKRCEQCARVEDTHKRMEKETSISEDLSGLISNADDIVSQYIRLVYSDEYGNCKCYTCSEVLSWKHLQAGHYIKRGNLYLRWDTDRNIRPQCPVCNCHKKGNMAIFAQNLEKEKPGVTDILLEESVLVYKPTREEIRQIISEYTIKVKELKRKLAT
jgi:hypothetical protein